MTIILKSQQTIACTSFHVTPPMHGNEANLHDNHAILNYHAKLIDKSIKKKKFNNTKSVAVPAERSAFLPSHTTLATPTGIATTLQI